LIFVTDKLDRLPIPIANYISRDVYDGQLKAWEDHPVKNPIDAILFIDVPAGEERKEENGTSFMVRLFALIQGRDQ
jgi:hypothetical protein